MPIYEFQCPSCQSVKEVFMKMTDSQVVSCDECKAAPMEKLMSPSTFHLKGGGWFKDGYDQKSSR